LTAETLHTKVKVSSFLFALSYFTECKITNNQVYSIMSYTIIHRKRLQTSFYYENF